MFCFRKCTCGGRRSTFAQSRTHSVFVIIKWDLIITSQVCSSRRFVEEQWSSTRALCTNIVRLFALSLTDILGMWRPIQFSLLARQFITHTQFCSLGSAPLPAERETVHWTQMTWPLAGGHSLQCAAHNSAAESPPVLTPDRSFAGFANRLTRTSGSRRCKGMSNYAQNIYVCVLAFRQPGLLPVHRFRGSVPDPLQQGRIAFKT